MSVLVPPIDGLLGASDGAAKKNNEAKKKNEVVETEENDTNVTNCNDADDDDEKENQTHHPIFQIDPSYISASDHPLKARKKKPSGGTFQKSMAIDHAKCIRI
eukprot:UN00489